MAQPVPGTAVPGVGRVLGDRYRLVSRLGVGASAAVYEAEDVVLLRDVAVKVLHPALAADPQFLRRFQAEAQVAAGLRHGNVLAIHDWGVDAFDHTPYLVMEHLEAGSLRDLLDQGHRCSPSQALVIGRQAARGLDHAHRRGLVHRDVKPANLLFDRSGRLCVADFGLARAIAEAAITEPLGAVLGTARYASPEQAMGRPLDGRSDVYALALCLIEAVTGTVPFTADTSAATLQSRVGPDVEVPEALGPLRGAIAAAGRADPDLRPDAAGFARLLQEAAPDLERPEPLPLTVPERRASSPVTRGDDLTVVPSPEAVSAAGAEPKPAAAPPQRRRWPRIVVALVVVAGLAAGGLALARFQPWQPMVAVPALAGRTEVDAREALRPLGIDAEVTGRRANETVPAGSVISATPASVRKGASVHLLLSSGPEQRTVPAAVGLEQADVTRQLEALALVVSTSSQTDEAAPAGRVLAVAPGAGERVARGTTIVLTVSAGPAPRPLPADVAGKSYDDVATALTAAGFVPQRVDVFDDTVPSGKVVATLPAAGASAPKGSTVTVNVSKGPDLVAVPNVSGKSPTAAASELTAAGFSVRATYGPPGGRVFTTDPKAGTRAKRGAAVSLYTQ